MKKIVISGVNLFEGGPLSVLRDALTELSKNFSENYEIVALVHKKELFEIPHVRYIEYPEIRRSWVKRIYFEYYGLRKISKNLNAYLWLSLHDMTPMVSSKIQAVYCHNPSPFFRLRWRDVAYEPRHAAFVLLYRYLYRINLHRNKYVIVQQCWLRKMFERMYHVNNVIVAHPTVMQLPLPNRVENIQKDSKREKFIFFFPAYPRVFKNPEVLLEAARILTGYPIEIWLTFSKQDGRYARSLVNRYNGLSNVKFLGRLTRSEVFERYEMTDCLVFPSLLETWGLPISEFKATGKPMLLADLPYAHETIGEYKNVQFFDPNRAPQLAILMRNIYRGSFRFSGSCGTENAPPFAPNWNALFNLLLSAT